MSAQQQVCVPASRLSSCINELVFCAQAFEAICDLEVQKVVLLCTTGKYTSLQFVAHSFEVMRGSQDAARLIAQPLPHLGCDQAESFMLNYAEVLLGGGSTWVLGAECLAWCPVYGADTLEAVLDKSPVSTCSGLQDMRLCVALHVESIPSDNLLPPNS